MKWGVMYVTQPTSHGLPKTGPNAGQITGWVRINSSNEFARFDTKKEADRLARRMRMRAYRRGLPARYIIAEYEDE